MKYLEIEHLKKTFDHLEVLKDISLSVEEGEVVSIIGPSGSGKSTLLRCATMLERMDGGSLSYLGERAAWEENGKCVYASRNDLKRIRKSYGLVFQSFHLFPHFSVLKNVMDERPDKGKLLRPGQFHGQGHFNLPGKLGIAGFLYLLHAVPEGGAVLKLRRGVRGQHDFNMTTPPLRV